MSKFFTLFVIFGLGITLIGCSRDIAGSGSSVAINFPSSSQGMDKVSALSTIPYANLCFFANITAPDIPEAPPSVCNPSLGTFKGSVGPGQNLEIDVPQGKDRKLEIFAYNKKAGESCSATVDGFGSLSRDRIYPVIAPKFFDALTEQMTLSVQLSLPAVSANLSAVNSYPAECLFAGSSNGSGGSLDQADTKQTSANFSLSGGLRSMGAKELGSTNFKVIIK